MCTRHHKKRSAHELKGGLSNIPGLLVGHAETKDGRTGCTVILYPQGAISGVDVRGGAPGTCQTDAIRPGTSTKLVQAVVLSGGSNFGLATASGVMDWLAERGFGVPTAGGPLPTVPAAIINDLVYAKGSPRPDAALGYAACQAADHKSILEGSVGAGSGATIGKIYGLPMKGGVGMAAWQLDKGLIVAALAVVNAVGDVWGHDHIIAGSVSPEGGFVNQTKAILDLKPPDAQPTQEVYCPNGKPVKSSSGKKDHPLSHRGPSTTIAVIVTTAKLTKADASRVATLGHDGFARAISPVHLQEDGDTIFCLATGTDESGLTGNEAVDILGTTAAVVLQKAIIRAAKLANAKCHTKK